MMDSYSARAEPSPHLSSENNTYTSQFSTSRATYTSTGTAHGTNTGTIPISLGTDSPLSTPNTLGTGTLHSHRSHPSEDWDYPYPPSPPLPATEPQTHALLKSSPTTLSQTQPGLEVNDDFYASKFPEPVVTYSTLEALTPRTPAKSELEVVPPYRSSSEKLVVGEGYDGKDGEELVEEREIHGAEGRKKRRRRMKWVIIGLVLLVLVMGVVLGVFVGLRKDNEKSSSADMNAASKDAGDNKASQNPEGSSSNPAKSPSNSKSEPNLKSAPSKFSESTTADTPSKSTDSSSRPSESSSKSPSDPSSKSPTPPSNSPSSPSTSKSPLNPSSNSPSLPPTRKIETSPAPLIRTFSGLSAIYLPSSSGTYSLRLFFQDKSDRLRFSTYSSKSNSWSSPESLGTIKAKAWTSIAGVVDPEGRTRVYFLDEEKCIQELIVDDSGAVEEGKLGEACRGSERPFELTRLASRWPYLFYQDDEGALNHFLLSAQGDQPTKAVKYEKALALKGLKGSGLGIAQTPGGGDQDISLFYQAKDWHLTSLTPTSQPTPLSLPWIPVESALAALTLGSTTFLLYQEVSGDLFVYTKEGKKGWKGPEQPEALKGVLVGSHVSCVETGGVGRCFLQSKEGERVREVGVGEEGEWRVLGTVEGV